MFPTFGKIRLHLENCTTIKEECIKEEKKSLKEGEREESIRSWYQNQQCACVPALALGEAVKVIPDTNLDSHTLSRRQQPNQPLNLRGGGGGGHDEPTPRILLIGSTRNTRKLLCANGKWSPKTICCCSLPSWPHGTTHTRARLGDLFAIVWLVYVLQQTLLAEHLLNGNNDGRGQSWNCSKWAAEYGLSGLGSLLNLSG